MSTPPEKELESALASLPQPFRERIISTYLSIKVAFIDGYLDAAGLRAAKFCEAVLRFLQHYLTGTHIPFNQKIPNLYDACLALERLAASAGHESLRLIIPRALTFLYTLRSKRGIGHLAGDVDANQIDAATAVRLADWVLCELIRFFHNMSLEEAQAVLDALVVRQQPVVWSVGTKRRVLDPSLSYGSQVLLILYPVPEGPVPVEDLCDWVEHPRLGEFRTRVLAQLHRQRLVEFDKENETVAISPTGIRKVEEELLPSL